MTERSRVRTWALAAAGVGVAGGAVFFGAKGFRGGKPGADRAVASADAAKVTANSSMRDLSKAIARGDGMALAILKNRLEESTKPPQAGTEAKPAVALT